MHVKSQYNSQKSHIVKVLLNYVVGWQSRGFFDRFWWSLGRGGGEAKNKKEFLH